MAGDSRRQDLSQALQVWGLPDRQPWVPLHLLTLPCPPCHPRTETVVEKLLTNWMSICLYTFVRVSEAEADEAPLQGGSGFDPHSFLAGTPLPSTS